MTLFKFPRIMIAVFAALILIGTAFSARAKVVRSASPAPLPPLRNPQQFRILSAAIAVAALALLCTFLFGFVIFMNAWDSWHRYEGQRYEKTEFEVSRVYYQRHGRGGIDLFASGTVDGQREWMTLTSWLQSRPHNQGELEDMVPEGTSIPIYLFPDLKGRSRVRARGPIPPAEAYEQTAMKALHYGLFLATVLAAILWLLFRLRARCYEPDTQMLAASPHMTIASR